MPSDEYFAGFFDGEGYIGVCHQKPGNFHMLKVAVVNNNRDVLELFQVAFGGSIATPKVNAQGSGKEAWTWLINGPSAIEFLARMAPYAVVKKPQAELALQFPIGHGARLTPEVRAQRHAIYEGLMRLKRESRTGYGESQLVRQSLESRDDVKQAMDLYQTGMTVEEVAQKMNVGFGAIAYWTRELGVNRGRVEAGRLAGAHRKDSAFTRPEALRAAELYKAGTPIPEIARQLNAKPATVNYWLRRQKVTRRLSESQQLRRQRERQA